MVSENDSKHMSMEFLADTWLGSETLPSRGRLRLTGRFEGERILVPLLTSEVPTVTDQIEVAATLARTNDAMLHVTNPIVVPHQTPGSLRHQITDEVDSELLNWALERATESTDRAEGSFSYGRRLVSAVLSTIDANAVDTVVLPGRSPRSPLRGSVTDRIATAATCDVITVNGQPGYEPLPSLLLPIAGGPHSGLAVDIAERIARECGAWIDALHVVESGCPNSRRTDAESYLEEAYQRIARPETTTTRILEADDPVDAIVEQSQYYDLTVLGAPTKGRLRRLVTGSANRSIRNRARSVVLSACNNTNTSSLDHE